MRRCVNATRRVNLESAFEFRPFLGFLRLALGRLHGPLALCSHTLRLALPPCVCVCVCVCTWQHEMDRTSQEINRNFRDPYLTHLLLMQEVSRVGSLRLGLCLCRW